MINLSPSLMCADQGYFAEEIKQLEKDYINQTFLLEVDRKVSIDCVIQIDNIEFEVPQQYSKRQIKIRYSNDYKNCYVVNPDGGLDQIKLLDKKANGQIKRKQPIFDTEAQQ